MAYDAQAFASGQSASGNGVMDMLGQQMAGLQVQNAGIQQQAARQQMAMQRIALQRQQQYTQDVSSFAQNPTVNGLASLWKYPEFQASTKGIYDAMDPRMRQAEATQLGSFASVLQNAQQKDGTYSAPMLKQAADIVQQRIAADKAAGRDTAGDEQALQMVQSGDPKQINAVKAMTAGLIAGAVGFDKAGDYLKAVGFSQEPVTTEPGKTVTNPLTQQTVVSQPSNLIPEPLTNADGSQRLDVANPNPGAPGVTQTEGGGPASGVSGGGLQASVAHVLGNEGGYNPKDANGSPTNFGINFKANAAVLKQMGITPANFKNMTQDQAAQIYATKYWPQSGAEKLPSAMQAPYFDVYVRSPKIAKMALAKSGGGPQAFMQIANSAFQSMASNPNSGTAPYKSIWAKRDAGNMALAANAAPPTQGGNQGGVPAQVAPGPGQAVTLDNGGTPGALNTKGAPTDMAWNPQHTAVVPVPNGPADPHSYSPQEIDDLARNWIATGPTAFASLGGGMGGGGIAQLKKAALARATEMMGQAGISADDLPAIRSKYGALNSSMGQNTQILNMLQASEKALHPNAQQVLLRQDQLVKDGIIGNGSPWINRKKLELYAQIGSPEVKQHIAQYETAVQGLSNEYTKFMNAANGMGGNAAPSDASRNLAMDLNDPGYGPVTMKGHINQIFTETSNKRNGVQSQNESIQNQLANLLAPHHARANALPQGAKVIGTYKGRRVIEVNGQRLVEQ